MTKPPFYDNIDTLQNIYAGMAELADALDSGSSGATRTGSSPATCTMKKDYPLEAYSKGQSVSVKRCNY